LKTALNKHPLYLGHLARKVLRNSKFKDTVGTLFNIRVIKTRKLKQENLKKRENTEELGVDKRI
jgi:hypothetical protein